MGLTSSVMTTAAAATPANSCFRTRSPSMARSFGMPPASSRVRPAKGARFTSRDCGMEGIKQGGKMYSSKSPARKAASAQIAMIPFELARWIARVYKPAELERFVDEA